MSYISKHPYQPFIPDGATSLIIGTIPPARFCKPPFKLKDDDVDFYYGSRDNYFWELIGEVFETKLVNSNTEEAVKQRKELLKANNLAITDIIESCIHPDESAKDSTLEIIQRKPIEQLLKEHDSIQTLIYTSEFVKKQINHHFDTYHSINSEDKKRQSLKLFGKTYQVKILYSPSPMGLINLGEDGIEKRLKQYKDFLIEK